MASQVALPVVKWRCKRDHPKCGRELGHLSRTPGSRGKVRYGFRGTRVACEACLLTYCSLSCRDEHRAAGHASGETGHRIMPPDLSSARKMSQCLFFQTNPQLVQPILRKAEEGVTDAAPENAQRRLRGEAPPLVKRLQSPPHPAAASDAAERPARPERGDQVKDAPGGEVLSLPPAGRGPARPAAESVQLRGSEEADGGGEVALDADSEEADAAPGQAAQRPIEQPPEAEQPEAVAVAEASGDHRRRCPPFRAGAAEPDPAEGQGGGQEAVGSAPARSRRRRRHRKLPHAGAETGTPGERWHRTLAGAASPGADPAEADTAEGQLDDGQAAPSRRRRRRRLHLGPDPQRSVVVIEDEGDDAGSPVQQFLRVHADPVPAGAQERGRAPARARGRPRSSSSSPRAIKRRRGASPDCFPHRLRPGMRQLPLVVYRQETPPWRRPIERGPPPAPGAHRRARRGGIRRERSLAARGIEWGGAYPPELWGEINALGLDEAASQSLLAAGPEVTAAVLSTIRPPCRNPSALVMNHLRKHLRYSPPAPSSTRPRPCTPPRPARRQEPASAAGAPAAERRGGGRARSSSSSSKSASTAGVASEDSSELSRSARGWLQAVQDSRRETQEVLSMK